MKRASHQEGKATLDIVEEAAHLLRGAPASCLAAYYLGSVPFVIGLLFFWADMSRSAFATYHTVEAALGMALLFFWMKTWQAIFARRLRAVLSGHAPKPLRPGEMARLAISQAAIHAAGLFVLPLSLIAVIPFGWVFAFAQNATALGEDGLDGLPRFSAKLARHSTLWPYQNHGLVLTLFGFGILVFLNWTSVCLALPFLAKTLFGIESIYSRNVFGLLNTTFFAAMLGLTYLAVDPLVKAAYSLRCFYGDSLKSGEDVRAGLKRLAAMAQSATGRIAAVMLCVLIATTELQAGRAANPERIEATSPGLRGTSYPGSVETIGANPNGVASNALHQCRFTVAVDSHPNSPSPETVEMFDPLFRATISPLKRGVNETRQWAADRGFGLHAFAVGAAPQGHPEITPAISPASSQQFSESVPPEELGKAIEDTIKKRKYAWRMPRGEGRQESAEQSMLGRFFEKVGDLLQQALKTVGRWLDNLLRNLFQRQNPINPGSFSFNWATTLKTLTYLLIAIVVGVVLWLLFRYWKAGRLPLASFSSVPIEPAPDLTDENVGADQLPEDGWIRLGRELLEQGEFRLALRAFYLASLAHLAERNLVNLAKFKSNRDYQRELQRRAHAFPEIASVFDENVGVFDRVWYGRHEADAELVVQFEANVQRLKGVAP